jgi:hypothetical protein
VESNVLYGQFWAQVRYLLQFTKPIYNMIWFADRNQQVIREVYGKMDSMLGHIKDIVEKRDVILYDCIHKYMVKKRDNLNVSLHDLPYVLTPKYYSSSWLDQPTPRMGLGENHLQDTEVKSGYMLALDKLVPDNEECAQVQSELSKYISEHRVFANQHSTKD